MAGPWRYAGQKDPRWNDLLLLCQNREHTWVPVHIGKNVSSCQKPEANWI